MDTPIRYDSTGINVNTDIPKRLISFDNNLHVNKNDVWIELALYYINMGSKRNTLDNKIDLYSNSVYEINDYCCLYLNAMTYGISFWNCWFFIQSLIKINK